MLLRFFVETPAKRGFLHQNIPFIAFTLQNQTPMSEKATEKAILNSVQCFFSPLL
jgi:hypothetical protein